MRRRIEDNADSTTNVSIDVGPTVRLSTSSESLTQLITDETLPLVNADPPGLVESYSQKREDSDPLGVVGRTKVVDVEDEDEEDIIQEGEDDDFEDEGLGYSKHLTHSTEEQEWRKDEEEELQMFGQSFWGSAIGRALNGCGRVANALVGRLIPKGSIFASIFELLSATLGAGTLSLPFAFRVSGVGLAGILMLVGAVAAYYSIYLLVRCSDITHKRSYEDMTRAVFGRKVEILLDISIITFAWGSTVGYLVAIGDIVPQVLEMLRITEVLHEWFVERWVIMTAVTIFIIFPLSMLKKLSSLRFTATLGFLATCYLVLAVFARTTESIAKEGFDKKGELVIFDWGSGFFIAAPIIFYAYSSHVNIFSIYAELTHPTPRRINYVILGDVLLAFLVYASIGLFGYLQFFSDTDANILNNYSSDDIPIQLGAIALVWSIIFNIPLNNHPCRITVDYMLFGPNSRINATARHWIETFVIVYLALLISILVPNITTIFSLLGATATAFCCYIMPAILYLKVGDFKLWSWEALPCLLLVLTATTSSITSTVIILMDIISGGTA